MECVANARPLIKLSITWRKNRVLVTSGLSDFNRRLTIISPVVSDSGFYECEAVLRSSSVPSVNAGANLHVQVKTPRYRVLVGGSLQVNGLLPDDTGMFQCFARNLAGEVQTNTYLAVTSIAPNITAGPSDSTVIDGMSVILHCETSGAPRPAITWQKGERVLASGSVQLPRFTLLESGSLLISPSHISDAGTYTCMASNSRGIDEAAADLVVWENPAALLSSSEKRAINLIWAKPFDGNSPLIRYILEVSENNAPWAILLANIEPELTAVTVSGLIPARSYQFRLCAVNDVGKGQFSKETDRVSLPEEPPSAPPQNVIASGRTNQSIMIQWQTPPESHQNGVLRGYSVRYRLTGLPVDYQSKNISKPDVTNILLEDLIIWTNYEIEVAAYNGAGLGTFSHKVTEWTLQGVPTIAPSDVQVEAINSTTIRITWAAPNPQFINGINQGYKLLAWEPGQEEEVTMVTVRPNYQDSVHVGYVTGLKKFTEYYSSVLCFTTPGDGPRSPANGVRTHEDTPGAVGHLSFTEILDTSLKVSWREPGEKNGVLTGYRISWEEFNRTNTRVTHYLPNVTLEYRVTGLTALTTYTIEVAGMTSKGQGQLSSSTISSGVPPGQYRHMAQSLVCTSRSVLTHGSVPGVYLQVSTDTWLSPWCVPPELPGPPTNMAISNIGPRSITLQFKPGYDGKTSISRWQVEAQVSVIGDNEDWVTVHQLLNEPDARSLEVPGLNPYTFYRFRMRQVNIVGTSAPSLPSRKIQTLQAPPDMSPANVTLRTASETSLWLRWVPLPEWEYNGDPEVVGYRVQYFRTGFQGRALTHVIADRQEREFTIEDLGEWTEYEVRVQALNGIGAGPWSQPVRGRTRESDLLWHIDDVQRRLLSHCNLSGRVGAGSWECVCVCAHPNNLVTTPSNMAYLESHREENTKLEEEQRCPAAITNLLLGESERCVVERWKAGCLLWFESSLAQACVPLDPLKSLSPGGGWRRLAEATAICLEVMEV
ncbi:unnamed protein product, partial [Coregonus sp. 'balchen']